MRAAALTAAGALLFVLGLALGQALTERPAPPDQTYVRTLDPSRLPPPPTTVTVTETTSR